VFGRICGYGFTFWDDSFNIWLNPHMNPPSWATVARYWTRQEFGLYAPLTHTAWSALASFAYSPEANPLGGHLDPFLFHAANLLLHLGSAIVVWAIVRRIVKDDLAACIGALVFALHPLQVEAVAWVSGLKDVLSGFLSLTAIWLYLRGVDARERRRSKRYALATLTFALALVAKPAAVIAPAVAWVLHVWGLGRSPREATYRLWPWFGLSLAAAVIGAITQNVQGGVATPLWARPFLAGDSLAFYLTKLFLPFHLGIDYGRRPLTRLGDPWFYLSWIGPAALLVALWRIRIERSVLWAAALVFVVALTPVLGFVRFGYQFISQVADHYVYLSMLGAALAVAWLISRRPTAKSIAAGCLVVFALGARSMGQASVWRSDFTLFEHAIEVNPDSSSAWYHLGFAQRAARHDAAAIGSFENAIRIDPDYWQARWHLAGILLGLGEKDAAIAEMRKSLAIRSTLLSDRRVDFFGDQVALGDVLMSLGRFGEATREYRTALLLRPQDSGVARKLRRARQRLQRGTDDNA